MICLGKHSELHQKMVIFSDITAHHTYLNCYTFALSKHLDRPLDGNFVVELLRKELGCLSYGHCLGQVARKGATARPVRLVGN